MITAVAVFIAGMFFDHFYPVPAKTVRNAVIAGVNLVRGWFTKPQEPQE